MAVNVMQLVDNQVVDTTAPAHSPYVSMDGANAVQLTIVISALTATSLTPELQGSNDLSNWEDLSTGWSLINSIGHSAPASETGIAYQYVRVEFTMAGAGAVIYSAHLATALL